MLFALLCNTIAWPGRKLEAFFGALPPRRRSVGRVTHPLGAAARWHAVRAERKGGSIRFDGIAPPFRLCRRDGRNVPTELPELPERAFSGTVLR
jgi:hypothetical protein